MTTFLDEAQVEDTLMDMLRGMGYAIVTGPEIAPDGDSPPKLIRSNDVSLARVRPPRRVAIRESIR